MTRISFLVPTFNRAAFLGQALHAICSQLGDEDEVLVIDDGSVDSTPEVVRAAGSRVRYGRQENAGKAAALNRALAESVGEFIWVCDDDDVLLPGAVARLSSEAAAFAGEVVFGRYRRAQRQDGRWIELPNGYWPDLSTGSLQRHVLEGHFIMQNASLVRRRAYAAIGGFDASLIRSVDYDASIRLALSFKMKFIDQELYEQREHGGMRGTSRVRIVAKDAISHWVAFDRTLFRNLHAHAPLSLYEAMFDAPSVDLRRRAALLQRAVTMARHNNWELACNDLEQAAQLACGRLDPGESAICERALSGKHGMAAILGDAIPQRLRALRRRSAIGLAIVDAILAGGRWRLRSRDRAQARAMLAALLRIAGPGAARIAMRQKHPKTETAQVTERAALPADAYLAPGTLPPITHQR